MASILLEFRSSISKSATSVEFWVVATTVLLLAQFSVCSLGRRFMVTYGKVINPGINLLGTLSYYCVSYALGLMQPASSSSSSTPTTNDGFHVWAVLIVTMQDSVNFGRPYKPKEVTMVDLLASLWSANQLREQTALYLKVPLWLIWSTRVSRIIWYYRSSVTAQSSLDNMKLVSDYMAQNASGDACPATMAGYAYLVLGEEQQSLEIEKPSFRLKLDRSRPGDLITVEKVWSLSLDRNGGVDRLLGMETDGDNRFKDVCLSFALYKLLRRRFFDFPINEARDRKTRQLVCDAILGDDRNGYERAFRVTEVELSFLRDFTYGKHAAVFAHGFPTVRLLLSLLMTGSVLFLAVAVRGIPSASSTRADLAGVTHGQLITRCIIVIIIWREIWEIGTYVLSQWTKLTIICHYIRLRLTQQRPLTLRRARILILLYHRLQCLIMEAVARIMWRLISRGRWDQKIQQYNLLLSACVECQTWGCRRFISLRRRRMVELELGVEAKRMLLYSIKSVGPQDHSLELYTQRAFPECSRIERLLGELEGETHKVLVWHVATCLCQIKLLEEARQPSSMYLQPTRPFIGGSNQATAPPRYSVAVSLSNYCAYLATQALLPGNGILAKKVVEAVRGEARIALRGCDAPREIYDTLVAAARVPAEGQNQTIVNTGALLSELLVSTYADRDDLWERLGTFWAWFLLHLSASTPADKHGVHLIKTRGELTTHLWALLSHAGFLGDHTSSSAPGHP